MESVANMTDRDAFEALVADVRGRVDGALSTWLKPKVGAARSVSAEAGAAAEAFSDLALRGGKRVRAALVAAGYDACGGDDLGTATPAMIAVELLHAYLLVHDDWMDEDDVRRGAPTVHVTLGKRLANERLGDAFAVLAGDLGCAYAQEALLASPVPADRLVRAARVFARIQTDVVTGQLAEMHAAASEEVRARGGVATLETVHALKTASYTVSGPLALGAVLAGADASRVADLARFGEPLGVAFQLRDDLLGVFGDPTATGKPVYNDIRQGKRTALVAELEKDPSSAALRARVLGDKHASAADIDALVRLMDTSGARTRVETRVSELSTRAHEILESIDLNGRQSRAWLAGAIAALGERAA